MWKGILLSVLLFAFGVGVGWYAGSDRSDSTGASKADELRIELAAEGSRLDRERELNQRVVDSIGERERGIEERAASLDRREIEIREREKQFERERSLIDRERIRISEDAGTVADIDGLLRKALEELGVEP